jgi:hypothetical protein
MYKKNIDWVGQKCAEIIADITLLEISLTVTAFTMQWYGFFTEYQAGRPTKCILNCGGPNARSSPNGDPATDSMASVIAHELAETVSDPDDEFKETRAWNDAQFMENGNL